jgi:peroxiredoxin
VSYNRAVGKHAVVLLALLVGCSPAPPPLNPYKQKPRGGPPEVDKAREMASDGTVTGRDGAAVSLASMWESSRVVVVFFRGHWCPHCQHQLGKLNEARADLEKGARLIAISSDSPEDAKALHAKLGLGFEVYADPQLAVITKWGVSDYTNGISLPATFVVEKGGAISYRKVGKKPTDHPSVEELRAALARE